MKNDDTSDIQPTKATERKGGERHLHSTNEKSSLPRERALLYGFESLSDAEIMAILLGTGTKGKNVLELSNEILIYNRGHLSELMRMSVTDITRQFSGIGRSKALGLLAALELGRRAAYDAAMVQSSQTPITKSQDSYELMRHKLQHLTHEEFWILLLNNSLKRITEVKIGHGVTTYTAVEIKDIIKAMIDSGANSVILFHNHPSGQLKPSSSDDILTRKIVDAAKLFDFRVIDHIIVTKSGYYSYADNGRLQ